MSLTQEVLARKISEDHNLTVAESRRILKTVLEAVTETLEQGQPVKLHGLASFQVKERPARKHRNPRTGEYFEAGAKNVVKVRVAKRLSDRVALLV